MLYAAEFSAWLRSLAEMSRKKRLKDLTRLPKLCAPEPNLCLCVDAPAEEEKEESEEEAEVDMSGGDMFGGDDY